MQTPGGKCKIDSVLVGEGSFELLAPLPSLSVKYAFCNKEGDLRFGVGHRNQNWSEETMDCLRALASSIERDICSDVFEGGTSACADDTTPDTSDGVPGF